MSAAIPATISKDILESVNSIMAQGVYIESTNIRVSKLLSDVKQLMNANPFEAHIAKAAVLQLMGNDRQMRYHLSCASKLGDTLRVNEVSAIGLTNLGYYQEAQGYYENIGSPEHGSFAKYFHLGFASFAFNTVANFIEKAKLMQLDLTHLDVETAAKAHAILQENQLNQNFVAELAEVAGRILRENGLFTANQHPDIEVSDDGGPPCIFITFRVNASYERAASLYDELVNRLFSTYETLPDAVHLAIRSAQ